MNTNEIPPHQTSISQMTPLPGESVQTSPDLLKFLLKRWEECHRQQHPNDPTQNALSQQAQEAIQSLLSFSSEYFEKNPPVHATADDGRVVVTLGDNQKVQIGGKPTKEFVPGEIEPSTSIKI